MVGTIWECHRRRPYWQVTSLGSVCRCLQMPWSPHLLDRGLLVRPGEVWVLLEGDPSLSRQWRQDLSLPWQQWRAQVLHWRDGLAKYRTDLERALQVRIQWGLREVLGSAKVIVAASATQEDAGTTLQQGHAACSIGERNYHKQFAW